MRIELHSGREQSFGLSTNLHYLGQSTDLKKVSYHLFFRDLTLVGVTDVDRRYEENDLGSRNTLFEF